MGSKPFDASLKDVIEAHPVDWARRLGASRFKSVRVIDADVSTVTGAADKAMLVESEEGDYVLHPELQSSHDATLPRRTWWANAVYHHRTQLPVLSTVILLRPQADGSDMTGQYRVQLPMRPKPYGLFEYDVLRLWQVPVEELLAGGIGVLPVATLADDASGRLPDVLRRIDERLKAEAKPAEAEKLRAATTVLMGLRHPVDVIGSLLKGMWPMWEHVLEDSSVIQEFMRRGEQRGVKIGEERGEERGIQIEKERASVRFRESLLRLGAKRFGPPDAAVRAAIESINDLYRLAALNERVLDVATWTELLA